MPAFAFGAKASNSNAVAAREEAPQFEKVQLAKGAQHAKVVPLGMRSLCCFCYNWLRWVCSSSISQKMFANNSFSMMMNSSQQMDRWTTYFDKPDDNRLGIMSNAYNIGSIASFFVV